MIGESQRITIPRYYRPWPHQVAAWHRRDSGKYTYYFKLWARQCIAGDTLVWTPDGMVRMDSINKGDEVYSLHDNQVVVNKVKDIWFNQLDQKPIIRIDFGYGHYIRTTYDHKFRYCNDEYYELYKIVWPILTYQEKTRLQDLCDQLHQPIEHDAVVMNLETDSVMLKAFNKDSSFDECFVTNDHLYVEKFPERTYDMTVENDHNFFIGDIKFNVANCGKDTDDIQYILKRSWDHPGTQSAYIGLNNVWITNQIFKKYIDGRKHWMDYPEEYIDVHETQKEVTFSNNPEGIAEARIKFIGFLNDEQLVGSSYDNFLVSEASLYKQSAFQFIRPIWDRKIAMGLPLFVGFNGTPRGMRNVMYDLMRVYSGVDDPADFPGEHLNKNGAHCYIDKVTIRDLMVPDGHGGFKHLYSDEDIEVLQSQYLREFGNLNFYKQENECDFTVVNAGLVYQGIEQLQKEGRFCRMNLDTGRPVYFAWDISAKDKISDATACIVFQWYNGRMVIYDVFEARGHSFVECVAEMAKRDYFHLIRWGILPWDSERSASSETPIEEARRMWPNIQWHALDKERVDRGIKLVRQLLPNMVINSDRCEWLMECFENYEYKRLEKEDDWAAKPSHNRYSHLMDAMRYAAMGVNEMQYLQLNDEGRENLKAGYYDSMDVYAPKEQGIFDRYPTMKKRSKDAGRGLSY